MRRVAIVGMEPRNPRPEAEDALLLAALRQAGVDAERVPWAGLVDWAAFDLAMVRTTWDYTGRLPEFLAWVDRVAALTTLWNPAPVLRWNAHKSYLVDLAARDVPVVPTRLVRAGEAARLADVAREAGWGRVVVKAAVDAGAARAWRGPPTEGQAHLDALLANGDALVQPFLPEVATEGESSLVFFDGVFSHAVRKLPASGDWRVQPQWGGASAPKQPTTDEVAVARAALAAVGAPTLHARVDLLGGRLMELELIEPYLFLDADTATTLARAILRRIEDAR